MGTYIISLKMYPQSTITWDVATSHHCYAHQQQQCWGLSWAPVQRLAMPLWSEILLHRLETGKLILAWIPSTPANSALDGILLMQCSQLLWTKLKYTRKIKKMKDPSSFHRQQNTLRLFLLVLDSPERKYSDSHCTALLLETSELMVGPSDLMQHAAVSNNFPVALCKSLLGNSEWSFETICFSCILPCVKPWILFELCWCVCIDFPLVSSQRRGRNQSRYTDLACFPDTALLWRIIIQLQICVGVVYYHLERESFDSCSHRQRELRRNALCAARYSCIATEVPFSHLF